MELHNFSSGIFQLACPEKNLKDISKAKFWRGKEEKKTKKRGGKGKKKSLIKIRHIVKMARAC